MSSKPWEEGYVAPEFDVVALKAEVGRNAGKASAATKQERKDMILQGEIDGNAEEVAKACISKLCKHLETRTEENLHPRERIFYQDFAGEYLRDFNPALAWIRAGGPPKSAHVRGAQVLRTPYCQQLIKQCIDSLEEENLITRKDVIMALWREANDRDPDGGANGGSRVRALMGLARIKQMDIIVPEKKETAKHNVMKVPMPVDSNAWAEAAEQSQNKLKSDVRT